MRFLQAVQTRWWLIKNGNIMAKIEIKLKDIDCFVPNGFGTSIFLKNGREFRTLMPYYALPEIISNLSSVVSDNPDAKIIFELEDKEQQKTTKKGKGNV